jgi:hypothetical protein
MRVAAKPLDQPRVPSVDAIEIPDRHRAPSDLLGDLLDVSELSQA